MTSNQHENKQFLKFALVICVSGVIFSTLAGVLWTNFSSIGNKIVVPTSTSLSYTAQVNPVAFGAITGATSDLEISPKPWWIWNKDSVFVLSNSSAQTQVVKLRLSLGRNPCGFEVTGILSFRNSLEALTPGKTLLLTIELEANSSITLPLSVMTFTCSIESDPRLFLSSLTSTFTYYSPSEFVFDQ